MTTANFAKLIESEVSRRGRGWTDFDGLRSAPPRSVNLDDTLPYPLHAILMRCRDLNVKYAKRAALFGIQRDKYKCKPYIYGAPRFIWFTEDSVLKQSKPLTVEDLNATDWRLFCIPEFQ